MAYIMVVEEWMPVSDFLEKPVDFEVFKEKINQLLVKDGTTQLPD